jgi:TrpR-related protein YerC/YecD
MKEHRMLSTRDEQNAQAALCRALLALRTVDECRAFLTDLCTPAELQAMTDRWAVAQHLADGLSYRRIHELTGVSVTTIGRVARYLNAGAGGYARALQRTRK